MKAFKKLYFSPKSSIVAFLGMLFSLMLLMGFQDIKNTKNKEMLNKDHKLPVVILLGPPGSGKGTQGKILAKNLGVLHFSAGDLLRDIAKNDPVMGKEISAVIDKGQLLPDELINRIMKQVLESPKYFSGYILDGYPRNVAQAKFLHSFVKQRFVVIALKLDDDTIVKRILNRAICSNCQEINQLTDKDTCTKCGSNLAKRKDDNKEVALSRIAIYKKETFPVIEYFKGHGGVYEINANQDINNITKILLDYIKSI